ncbi:hypothetical protein [Halorubrum californiense]|uniref:hypothetical protein n=1 Tax=Halorubrum californiense TaxID=416585 RepID=UPI0012689028|nr:hypothetical protein [Halorubrum californiense]
MNPRQLAEVLSETGLHHESVQRLVQTYETLETHLERGEYTQATDQVETFCQAYVHILNIELGEPLERDTDVREFVAKSRNDVIANDAPASVQEFIPDMLNAAINTARARDTGPIGLNTSINRSDARVGVSIASWLVVELVRLYLSEDEFEDHEIESLITELVTPIKEQPLHDLVRSRYEFDEQLLARELAEIVYLVPETEEIAKGQHFPSENQEKKITALLLGRVAACNLGFSETLGVERSWINDRIEGVASQGTLDSIPFVFKDTDEGGYYIPGFRVGDALDFLTDES